MHPLQRSHRYFPHSCDDKSPEQLTATLASASAWEKPTLAKTALTAALGHGVMSWLLVKYYLIEWHRVSLVVC